MNRKHVIRALGLSLLLPFALSAGAAEAAATPAEAEAMVQKASAFLKANGPEKLFAEVTNGKQFKDRDLYIFIYDMNGKCLAHGANPKLVGKELLGMKDPDGKPLIKMLIDVAKDKGKGWTDTVKFRNPVNDNIQTRVNYIERAGDIVIGSGVFKA